MITAISQRLKILEDFENPLYLDVHPITSGEEKLGLEIQAIQDFKNHSELVDDICKLYGVDTSLPTEIKLAALLKVKEVSNGADVQLKYKCTACQRLTEFPLMLENMLEFDAFNLLKDSKIDKLSKFRKITLKDSVSIKDLSDIKECKSQDVFKYLKSDYTITKLSDINLVLLTLKARYPKLKTDMSARCMFCSNEDKVKINEKFVLDALSEHSISSMYKTYHTLMINGMSKGDVDSMFPFEREVHIGLIDEKVKSLKESRNSVNSQ